MPKTYIAAAFTRLSKLPNSNNLCDAIALKLTQKSASDVNKINRELNFGPIESRGRDSELRDWRRAALLIEKTTLLSLGQRIPANQNWDESQLRIFINKQIALQYPMIGIGYYLKGSFWGFSNHQEREWVKASWLEAKRLLEVGLLTVIRSSSDTRSANIMARWFGREPEVKAKVKSVIEQCISGMNLKVTGLVYRGPGCSNNTKGYKETGAGNGNNMGDVTVNNDDWAYSLAAANALGFCPNFFTGNIAQTRQALHDLNKSGIWPSRGGAMVHELTHQFANTKDHKVPNEAYQYLGKDLPQEGGLRATAYGSMANSAMASSAAKLTRDNADSYRLFCEDAFLIN